MHTSATGALTSNTKVTCVKVTFKLVVQHIKKDLDYCCVTHSV